MKRHHAQVIYKSHLYSVNAFIDDHKLYGYIYAENKTNAIVEITKRLCKESKTFNFLEYGKDHDEHYPSHPCLLSALTRHGTTLLQWLDHNTNEVFNTPFRPQLHYMFSGGLYRI